MLNFDEMRAIYEGTEIVRKPTYGIVKGYHKLPYVCLGSRGELGGETLRVRGSIEVSPRFLIRPDHLDPSFGEIFGEDNVDGELTGRIFGYLGFRSRPVECSSQELEVTHLDSNMDRVLDETLDEMARMEDITTGIIVTPNYKYYPLSIERFIATILEDEFSV
jgi:hypothetical protein